MRKQERQLPPKTEANSGTTQISLAKIGLVSAISVAVLGMIGTALNAYFSSQAASAPILIPIQATQTAEANTLLNFNAVQTVSSTPIVPSALPVTGGDDWTTIFQLYSRKGTCLEPAVIPDTIDLKGDPDTVLMAVYQAMENKEADTWQSAPMQGSEIWLTRNIVSRSENTEWIELSNTIHVTVRRRNEIPDHVNVTGECAGSGEFRTFSAITLASGFDKYEITTAYSDADFFTLQPGEFESFKLSFQCTTPGFYIITINIPYTYLNGSGTITFIPPDLVCPKSYTVWEFLNGFPDPRGTYTWNGTAYTGTP